MNDIFRKEYKPLSDDQKHKMGLIKDHAEQLMEAFINLTPLQPDPRMVSLAKTNLEQSVMWAIKSIAG